ncbi:hypothetical protein BLX42_20305 [Pseudomonas sp. SG-MS2]|nr:hypothetical protein BLX42_20305 [Pseudomonas sp. SG-MS2]
MRDSLVCIQDRRLAAVRLSQSAERWPGFVRCASEVSGGRAWRQCQRAQKARITWTSGFSPAQVRAFGSEGRESGGAMGWTGIMHWILTCDVTLIKAVNGNLHSGNG